MKILYFSPKANRPIIRSLFRRYEFKGSDKVEDLIKHLCDPFDYCFFDLDVFNDINMKIFNNLQSIFMSNKILKLKYSGRSSEVFSNNSFLTISNFLKTIDNEDANDRRKTLRMKCNIPIEILNFDDKGNHQCYVTNISVNGLFIAGVINLKRKIDIIIDKRYTAQAKLCWSNDQNSQNPGHGVELVLDEPDKFKKFVKKEILPLSILDSIEIII